MFILKGYNHLTEQKKRRTLKLRLKRFESEIDKLAKDYEKINKGQTFNIYGLNYIDFIKSKKCAFENQNFKV